MSRWNVDAYRARHFNWRLPDLTSSRCLATAPASAAVTAGCWLQHFVYVSPSSRRCGSYYRRALHARNPLAITQACVLSQKSMSAPGLLLRPQERWRSIVMSTSVCVCVCLSVCPRAYLPNNTRDLYQTFCACCLWPWFGPRLAGWLNHKGTGQFWGFSSPLRMHCMGRIVVWISLRKTDFA